MQTDAQDLQYDPQWLKMVAVLRELLVCQQKTFLASVVHHWCAMGRTVLISFLPDGNQHRIQMKT